jgi:Cof subfamily protein (haloacid dehalogenase superfamily)
MRRRKLLAFDLDQTIVTNDDRLPDEIRTTIFEARAAGHISTVLTGRPLAAAQPVLDELKQDGWFSVNHGALVMGAEGTVLRQLRMDRREAVELIAPVLDSTLEFSYVAGDTLYVRDPAHERWNWVHTRSRTVELYHPGLEVDPDKVVFNTTGNGPELEQEIARRFPHFVTYLWGDGYLEVTGPDADKAAALKLLSEQLGVEQRDTIAFGDGLNDLTMLGWAGHSVAVGPHAHPSVLEIAAEHIASPEELGVKRWLRDNLLRTSDVSG